MTAGLGPVPVQVAQARQPSNSARSMNRLPDHTDTMMPRPRLAADRRPGQAHPGMTVTWTWSD